MPYGLKNHMHTRKVKQETGNLPKFVANEQIKNVKNKILMIFFFIKVARLWSTSNIALAHT